MLSQSFIIIFIDSGDCQLPKSLTIMRKMTKNVNSLRSSMRPFGCFVTIRMGYGVTPVSHRTDFIIYRYIRNDDLLPMWSKWIRKWISHRRVAQLANGKWSCILCDGKLVRDDATLCKDNKNWKRYGLLHVFKSAFRQYKWFHSRQQECSKTNPKLNAH